MVVIGNGAIKTFLYSDPGVWNLFDSFDFAGTVGNYPVINTWSDNSTLIFVDTSNYISIYNRTDQGGWTLATKFSCDHGTTMATLIYTGVDTMFFVFTTSTPMKIISYSKVNNEWVRQALEGDQIPVGASSNLGYFSYTVINKDIIALGAVSDGMSGKKRSYPEIPFGKILFLQRQSNNSWEITAQSKLDRIGGFGGTLLLTTNQIVTIFGDSVAGNPTGPYPITFYTIPRCAFEPVTATCFDYNSDTCDIDFMNGNVFSVTERPVECGNYTVSVSSMKNESYLYSATLSFDTLVTSYSCNASITCPVPPTVTPISAPTSAPSSTPMNEPTNAPINTPGSTRTPVKVASDASISFFGTLALTVLALAL